MQRASAMGACGSASKSTESQQIRIKTAKTSLYLQFLMWTLLKWRALTRELKVQSWTRSERETQSEISWRQDCQSLHLFSSVPGFKQSWCQPTHHLNGDTGTLKQMFQTFLGLATQHALCGHVKMLTLSSTVGVLLLLLSFEADFFFSFLCMNSADTMLSSLSKSESESELDSPLSESFFGFSSSSSWTRTKEGALFHTGQFLLQDATGCAVDTWDYFFQTSSFVNVCCNDHNFTFLIRTISSSSCSSSSFLVSSSSSDSMIFLNPSASSTPEIYPRQLHTWYFLSRIFGKSQQIQHPYCRNSFWTVYKTHTHYLSLDCCAISTQNTEYSAFVQCS